MMILPASIKFHHVGIGTKTFKDAISIYTALGYELICAMDDLGLDIQVAFLKETDGPYIEIIAPLGTNGPLKSLLARGLLPSPYHTCYETPDIAEAGKLIQNLGFFPVLEPQPAIAFGGALISYHYHPAIGLFELVEDPPKW
jgi:methylmalonyl-CoA/ethylmalonyl-CoA epimerase